MRSVHIPSIRMPFAIRRAAAFAAVLVPLCMGAVRSTRAEQVLPSGMILYEIGFSASQFSRTNLRDAVVAMDFWMETMSKSRGIDYTANSTVYHDLEKLFADTRDEKLDILSIQSTEYLQLKDRLHLDPFAVGIRTEDSFGEHVPLRVQQSLVEEVAKRHALLEIRQALDVGPLD